MTTEIEGLWKCTCLPPECPVIACRLSVQES